MLLCYVDEAGNEQVLDATTPDAPPALVIAGLIVQQSRLRDLTWGYLQLKRRNQRGAPPGQQLSDLIRAEIKGSNLRSDIRSGSRRRANWAFGILDQTVRLLEQTQCTVTSQIWIKREGHGLSAASYYKSVAEIAEDFHGQLQAHDTVGVMILDARTKSKNTPNVHGVTTRKFRSGGDPLPRLAESPVFGHSDSHVGLQVADIVASAILFPLACLTYCDGMPWNTHCHPDYQKIQDRYGVRLHRLEARHTASDGTRSGGIKVRDLRNHRPSLRIFGGQQLNLPQQSVKTKWWQAMRQKVTPTGT